MAIQIVSVRDNPDLLDRAVAYFSAQWGVDRRVYDDCIRHSLDTASPLPRWYLLCDGDAIIGCYGLIANDFISRQDLWPWLCALFVDPAYRKRGYGGLMLMSGRREAAKLGFPSVYLATDHTGYYERYDWQFLGMGYHPWDDVSRIYTAPAVSGQEDTASQ